MIEEELEFKNKDPLIKILSRIVGWCVRLLAILMVVVIIWSTLDVVYDLWGHSLRDVAEVFNVENLLADLGTFLAVMIAIEIYMNIVLFINTEKIHVPLVLATALTAIARKVIILDYSKVSPDLIYAISAVIAAVGLVFWLLTKKGYK